MSSKLMQRLQQVEQLATSGRMARAMHQPLRYLQAQYFLKYTYPKTRKGMIRRARTFFGKEMKLLLPAATDIYLTGGKTHDSEIRLAKFLIRQLRSGDTVIDIGAHFGYFTLLSATLVGQEGKVYAFEAAKNTYALLKANTEKLPQVQAIHRAMSGTEEVISFYEFPVLYSEYNSMDVTQFEQEAWIKEYRPVKTEVQAITLDSFTVALDKYPALIKIDVEGAEDKVIEGAEQLLREAAPLIVMEYLSATKQNAPHKRAAALLMNYGYTPHFINSTGETSRLPDVEQHLQQKQMESDNIVFIKNNKQSK